MPNLVCSLEYVVGRLKKTTHYKLPAINFRGFSLIELMVVVSLFGISASLVTASYLTFERNQRVKNGAVQLRNSLRFVQNKASSGDKGLTGTLCNTPVSGSEGTLAGWYIKVDTASGANTSYILGGDCLNGTSEVAFTDTSGISQQVLALPLDTKISSVTCTGCAGIPTVFFFRPLKNGVSFHLANTVGSGSVDLLDNNLQPINPQTATSVTIVVSNTAGTRTSSIVILSTGEVQ
ncbi:MAG TPA: prepilin-type N-terminal cleavage/methylation domain-containing protein [Candidatus Saccharimonadales bacterium]|nr:prepilin-type N-terminal cleavage/methylation domain-containing protein [Candidatus Saccharimonadales bacterium]